MRYLTLGEVVELPQPGLAVGVEEFEPERKYTELEVNRTLLESHEDVATMRRDLVDLGYVDREAGVYWRTMICERER